MVRANKRLPSSVSVSKSALDGATSTLQGLPEKPRENWSLREAVSLLQESISASLSKGYSYEEVAKMLTENGVEISASSLKSYLSAAKRQKGISSPSRGRKAGRQSKQVEENSLNGSAPATSAQTAKAKPADTVVELPAAKPTRRKTKAAAPATTTRKTAAKAKPEAKTTTKTVTKSATKTPSSRSRKKSS